MMHKTCITILLIFSLFSHLISQEQITNHKGTAKFGQEFIHEYNDILYRIYFDDEIMIFDITDSSDIKLLYDIDLPVVENSAGSNGAREIYLYNNYVIYNPAQYLLNGYSLYFVDLETGQINLKNFEGDYIGFYFSGHTNKKLFLNATFRAEPKSEIIIFEPETNKITKPSIYESEIIHYSDTYLFYSVPVSGFFNKNILVSYNFETQLKDTISENVRFFNYPKTDYLGGVLFLDSLGNIFVSKGSKFNTEQLLLNGKSDILKYAAFNYKDKISICRTVGDSLEFYTKKGLAISSIYLQGYKDNGYVRNILETTEKDIIIMGRSVVSVDKNTKEYAIFEIPQTWISGVGYDLEAINENHIFQDSFVMFYHHSTSSVMDLYLLNVNTMLANKVNWTDQIIINYNKKFIKRNGYFYLSGYNQESGNELYVIDFSGNKMPFTGDYVPSHNGTQSIGDPLLYFGKIIYPSQKLHNIFTIDQDKKLVPMYSGLESTFGPVLAGDYYYLVNKSNNNKRSIYKINPDLSTSFVYENDKEVYGIHYYQGKIFIEEGINSQNYSITKTVDLETKEVKPFDLSDYQFLYSSGDDVFLKRNNSLNKEIYKYNLKAKVLSPLNISIGYWGIDFFKTLTGSYILLKNSNSSGTLYRIHNNISVFIAEKVFLIEEICPQKVIISIIDANGFIYDENTDQKLEIPHADFTVGKIDGEIIILSYQTNKDGEKNILESKILRYDCNENKLFTLQETSSEEYGEFNKYDIINGKIFKHTLVIEVGKGEMTVSEIQIDFSTTNQLFRATFTPSNRGIVDLIDYFSDLNSPDSRTLFLKIKGAVLFYDFLDDTTFVVTFGINNSDDIDKYEFSKDNVHYFTSPSKYNSFQLFSYQFPEATAIPIVNSQDHILLYPIPSSDFIYLHELESATYNISSLDGKIVHSGIMSDGRINISHLPVGLFVLSFIDKNILPKKFIKQ